MKFKVFIKHYGDPKILQTYNETELDKKFLKNYDKKINIKLIYLRLGIPNT